MVILDDVMAHLKKNAPLLKALYHATPRKHKDILAHGSPDFLQALCKEALNLLKRNIPLSLHQNPKKKNKNHQTSGR